jgi:hypothetical protein
MYQPPVDGHIVIDNLPFRLDDVPAGVDPSVSVEIYARFGVDLVPLTLAPRVSGLQGNTFEKYFSATSGGDVLRVNVGLTAVPVSSTTERIIATAIAPLTTFDASTMTPMFESLTTDSPRPLSMAWTGGNTGGTLIAVAASDLDGQIAWRAYLDPSATSVNFPALPPDLGVPMPRSTSRGAVVRYDVPGATASEILRTLDRVQRPPYDDALLSPEGVAMATITFDSAGVGAAQRDRTAPAALP